MKPSHEKLIQVLCILMVAIALAFNRQLGDVGMTALVILAIAVLVWRSIRGRQKAALQMAGAQEEMQRLRRVAADALKDSSGARSKAESDAALIEELTSLAQSSARSAEDQHRDHNDRLAQERMALVASLVKGIGHEFNNLHGVLLAQLERLQDEVGEGAAARVRIDEAVSTVQRAVHVTRSLMTFIRSSQRAEHQLADLGDMVRGTVALLQTQIDGAGIAVSVQAPVLKVRCDPAGLRQALFNLLINAIEAVEDIPDPRIEVVVEGHGSNDVLLTMTDNGIGIPEDIQQKVFLPFESSRSTHDRPSDDGSDDGVGLGLAIVRSIIDQHRGTITVNSKTGVGTTFSIVLPAPGHTTSRRGATEDLDNGMAEIAGRRILVVEDDDSLRELLTESIEELGALVTNRANGREALEYLGGGKVDLVLMDIRMPGLSGIEVAEAMADNTELAQIPVVLMSGAESEEEDLLPGAVALTLRKPFRPSELLQELGSVLANH